MRIRELNWMQLEAYLKADDRIVLPVGSTEQHAYLSLETDNILAERAAVEAAEPLGVPVLPVTPYGVTGFTAYPGSPTLRASTLLAVLSDVADSLLGQGFARVLVVNGHGGNTGPGRDWARESSLPDRSCGTSFGRAGPTRSPLRSIPTTTMRRGRRTSPGRGFRVWPIPEERKPPVEWPENGNPETWREALGDGSFGGLYQRSPEDEGRLWEAAVQAIRERLERWDA